MQRRFSLIGTGFAEVHARYLLALGGWSLDTVYCLENLGKAQALCDALGGRSARRMNPSGAIADEADLVIVSSYPAHRLELLRRLDAPGRMLLVDKPFCGDEPGLEEFLRSSRSQLRAFFQWRAHPAVAALGSWLQGRAGVRLKITFLHDFLAQAQAAFLWRHNRQLASGGAIADLGIHCIDLAHFLMGPMTLLESSLRIDQAVRIADGESIRAETDDSGVLLLAAQGDRQARIEFSRVASQRSLRIEVDTDDSQGDAGSPPLLEGLSQGIEIDPDCWWVDPSTLKADDWRLGCYRDLLAVAADRVVPPAESILNCHSIYLQALQVKEH